MKQSNGISTKIHIIEIHKAERDNNKLQKLPDKFFEQMNQYIKILESERQTREQKDRYREIIRLRSEFGEIRLRKITNLAIESKKGHIYMEEEQALEDDELKYHYEIKEISQKSEKQILQEIMEATKRVLDKMD